MAEQEPQTFENHTRIVPLYHVGVGGILAINLLFQIARLYLAPRPSHVVDVLLALALLGLFFYARMFAVTVQDRVIRLEMRLRLREVLPADLLPRVPELTVPQLVALRFASDAEMADLVREVLAGTLTGRKEIKRKIRSWQADHLRA